MRYLILAAEYSGSCVKDEAQGMLQVEDLIQDKLLTKELEDWNARYKNIIPLEMAERSNVKSKIDALDLEGKKLAVKLEHSISGGAKVKYYSEGKLEFLY